MIFESLSTDIDAVITAVSRRHRLSEDEADDFRAEVLLKLIENDSAILRNYTGAGPIRSYLAVVVGRLHLDYRRKQWGKWRPSAEAMRHGPFALRLEELVYRDGLGLSEACVLLQSRGFENAEEEADKIWPRLPQRISRRTETLESFVEPPSPGRDPETEALERERRERLAGVLAQIEEYRANLPAEDRMVLRLRLDDGFTVAEIARLLELEQRPLYRRIPALLRPLRKRLERAGHTWAQIVELLGERYSKPRFSREIPIRKSVSETRDR